SVRSPGPSVRSPGPSGPGNHQTIYPAAFPRTHRLLEARGIPLVVVDVSELQKAEGAVTCCSLVFS
ncbi:MAG: hypothetical protein Q7V01_06980, partial [Vicinamibacterales bacterium]|nr:hypothetical protein [Vicinamibacterales bacterium]